MHRSIAAKVQDKRKRVQREAREQAALFRQTAEMCRYMPAQYPGLDLMFAIPNGAFLQGDRERRARQWARLKAQGAKEGVSDILLPVARGPYHGLWIEMKAPEPHDAPVTGEQRAWQMAAIAQGYDAHVARGTAQAISIIESYYSNGPFHEHVTD